MTRRRWFIPMLASLAFTVAFLPVLHADEIKDESQAAQREKRAGDVSAEAARKALENRVLEGFKKVTFEDILKDPDSIDLNFRYAKVQVQENDILGAAGTLERILMIRPDLAQIRLFYAIVLFRLDNLTEAERELNTLKTLKMPDTLREEVNLYVKNIRQRRQRTRLSLRDSTGFQIDTNRNAAPSSKRRLAAEVPAGSEGSDRRRGDNSFLNILSVDLVHDLGFQAGHEINASFTHFLQEQGRVDSLDLQSFQYGVGGTYKSQWFHLSPSFYASNVFLSDESFLRTQGGLFEVTREFKRRFDVFSNCKIERQDFSGISENTTAHQRSGTYGELELGGGIKLTPSMRWSNSFVYGDKHAKEELNAYNRFAVKGTHTWLLGRGQFLLNSIELGIDKYDEVDTSVAGRIRRDKTMRYRATYGLPLELLLLNKTLPRPLRDITLTFSYEYYRDLSSITNYSYTNHKYQGLITKKVDF